MIAMEDTYSKCLFISWEFKCKFRSPFFFSRIFFSALNVPAESRNVKFLVFNETYCVSEVPRKYQFFIN